jgi:hypothetical protein
MEIHQSIKKHITVLFDIDDFADIYFIDRKIILNYIDSFTQEDCEKLLKLDNHDLCFYIKTWNYFWIGTKKMPENPLEIKSLDHIGWIDGMAIELFKMKVDITEIVDAENKAYSKLLLILGISMLTAGIFGVSVFWVAIEFLVASLYYYFI